MCIQMDEGEVTLCDIVISWQQVLFVQLALNRLAETMSDLRLLGHFTDILRQLNGYLAIQLSSTLLRVTLSF